MNRQVLLLAALLLTAVASKSQTSGNWDTTTTLPKRIKTTSMGALGIGTGTPAGWQEIRYCPPVNISQNGLVVTKFDCVNPWNISMPDYGIRTGTYGTAPTEPVNFTVPFDFNIYPVTNTVIPLPTTGSGNSNNPLLWARLENTSITSGPNIFDTKFIVMPSDNTGINMTNPRAALDIRVITGRNEPAAIFGSIAPGTHGTGIGGLSKYKTQHLQFVPVLNENGYNRIVNRDDAGLFFTDGQGTDGANKYGCFVIAPWANNGNSNVGGIRIDSLGNVEVHGKFRSTKLNVNAKWWADSVFDKNYKLRPLCEVDSFIFKNHHLPEVPNEAQVISEGIDVAEMQALQMKKIEELTLYIIELEKKVNSLIAGLQDKSNP